MNTSFTTTGLATLATPATGLYLRVYKVLVEAYVTTVLAGATVGDPLVVCDNAIANVVGIGRIAGATTATRAAQGGAIISATDAVTVHYGFWDIDYGDGGPKLAAANNVLKFGAANTITTGVIAVVRHGAGARRAGQLLTSYLTGRPWPREVYHEATVRPSCSLRSKLGARRGRHSHQSALRARAAGHDVGPTPR